MSKTPNNWAVSLEFTAAETTSLQTAATGLRTAATAAKNLKTNLSEAMKSTAKHTTSLANKIDKQIDHIQQRVESLQKLTDRMNAAATLGAGRSPAVNKASGPYVAKTGRTMAARGDLMQGPVSIGTAAKAINVSPSALRGYIKQGFVDAIQTDKGARLDLKRIEKLLQRLADSPDPRHQARAREARAMGFATGDDPRPAAQGSSSPNDFKHVTDDLRKAATELASAAQVIKTAMSDDAGGPSTDTKRKADVKAGKAGSNPPTAVAAFDSKMTLKVSDQTTHRHLKSIESLLAGSAGTDSPKPRGKSKKGGSEQFAARPIFHSDRALSTSKQAGAMGDASASLGTRFADAGVRAGLYGGAAGVIFGGVQTLRNGMQAITEFEEALIGVRRVLNPLGSDMRVLSGEARNLAKEFGVPIIEVGQAMTIFAQQGKGMGQILDQTRVALLATNVTELTAVSATEALTAAINQFSLAQTDSLRILDAWNQVENTTSVNVVRLTEAVKKAGVAAKESGLTFDEFNGIVAATGEATRKSGQEIGTAMKFIFQRLRTDISVEALQNIGIYSIDSAGKMKTAATVLGELSGRWDKLTDAQRSYTAVQLAGTRQANFFLAMMNNYDRALDITATSLSSQGSAMRENRITMESFNKQVAQLTASWHDLMVELGDSGALTTLKQIVTTLRDVLSLVSDVNSATGGITGGLLPLLTVGGLGAAALGSAGALPQVPDPLARQLRLGVHSPRVHSMVDARMRQRGMGSLGPQGINNNQMMDTGMLATMFGGFGAVRPGMGRRRGRGGRRGQSYSQRDTDNTTFAPVGATSVGLVGMTAKDRKEMANSILQEMVAEQPGLANTYGFIGKRQIAGFAGLTAASVGSQLYQQNKETKPNEPKPVSDLAAETGFAGLQAASLASLIVKNVEGSLGNRVRGQGVLRLGALTAITATFGSTIKKSLDEFNQSRSAEAKTESELESTRQLQEKVSQANAELLKTLETIASGGTDVSLSQATSLRDQIAALAPGSINVTGDPLADIQSLKSPLLDMASELRIANGSLNSALVLSQLQGAEVKKLVDQRQIVGARLANGEGTRQERLADASELEGIRAELAGRLVRNLEAAAIQAGTGQTGLDRVIPRDAISGTASALGVTTESISRIVLEQFIEGLTKQRIPIDQLLGGRSAIELSREGYIQTDPRGPISEIGSGDIVARTADEIDKFRKKIEEANLAFVDLTEVTKGIAKLRPEKITEVIEEVGFSVQSLASRNQRAIDNLNFVGERQSRRFGGSSTSLTSISQEADTLRQIRERGSQGIVAPTVGDGPNAVVTLLDQLQGRFQGETNRSSGLSLAGAVQNLGTFGQLEGNIQQVLDRTINAFIQSRGVETQESFDGVSATTAVEFVRQIVGDQGLERYRAQAQRLEDTSLPQDERQAISTGLIDQITASFNRSLGDLPDDLAKQVQSVLQINSNFAARSIEQLGRKFDYLQTTGAVGDFNEFASSDEARKIIEEMQQQRADTRQQLNTMDLLARRAVSSGAGESVQFNLRASVESLRAALEELDSNLGDASGGLERLGQVVGDVVQAEERAALRMSQLTATAGAGNLAGLSGVNLARNTTAKLEQLLEEISKNTDPNNDVQRQIYESLAQQLAASKANEALEQQSRRDTKAGLESSVAIAGLARSVGLPSTDQPYIDVALAQIRELVERTSVEADRAGGGDALRQSVATALSPLQPLVQQLLLAGGSQETAQQYLLASDSEQLLADRIRDAIAKGFDAADILADPLVKAAVQQSPLAQQVLSESLVSEAQRDLLQVNKDMSTTLEQIRDNLKGLLGRDAANRAASGFATGTAMSGSPDVTAGRINRDEVPATLHRGEIVLNRQEADEYVATHSSLKRNRFASGTMQSDGGSSRFSGRTMSFDDFEENPFMQRIHRGSRRFMDAIGITEKVREFGVTPLIGRNDERFKYKSGQADYRLFSQARARFTGGLTDQLGLTKEQAKFLGRHTRMSVPGTLTKLLELMAHDADYELSANNRTLLSAQGVVGFDTGDITRRNGKLQLPKIKSKIFQRISGSGASHNLISTMRHEAGHIMGLQDTGVIDDFLNRLLPKKPLAAQTAVMSDTDNVFDFLAKSRSVQPAVTVQPIHALADKAASTLDQLTRLKLKLISDPSDRAMQMALADTIKVQMNDPGSGLSQIMGSDTQNGAKWLKDKGPGFIDEVMSRRLEVADKFPLSDGYKKFLRVQAYGSVGLAGRRDWTPDDLFKFLASSRSMQIDALQSMGLTEATDAEISLERMLKPRTFGDRRQNVEDTINRRLRKIQKRFMGSRTAASRTSPVSQRDPLQDIPVREQPKVDFIPDDVKQASYHRLRLQQSRLRRSQGMLDSLNAPHDLDSLKLPYKLDGDAHTRGGMKNDLRGDQKTRAIPLRAEGETRTRRNKPNYLGKNSRKDFYPNTDYKPSVTDHHKMISAKRRHGVVSTTETESSNPPEVKTARRRKGVAPTIEEEPFVPSKAGSEKRRKISSAKRSRQRVAPGGNNTYQLRDVGERRPRKPRKPRTPRRAYDRNLSGPPANTPVTNYLGQPTQPPVQPNYELDDGRVKLISAKQRPQDIVASTETDLTTNRRKMISARRRRSRDVSGTSAVEQPTRPPTQALYELADETARDRADYVRTRAEAMIEERQLPRTAEGAYRNSLIPADLDGEQARRDATYNRYKKEEQHRNMTRKRQMVQRRRIIAKGLSYPAAAAQSLSEFGGRIATPLLFGLSAAMPFLEDTLVNAGVDRDVVQLGQRGLETAFLASDAAAMRSSGVGVTGTRFLENRVAGLGNATQRVGQKFGSTRLQQAGLKIGGASAKVSVANKMLGKLVGPLLVIEAAQIGVEAGSYATGAIAEHVFGLEGGYQIGKNASEVGSGLLGIAKSPVGLFSATGREALAALGFDSLGDDQAFEVRNERRSRAKSLQKGLLGELSGKGGLLEGHDSTALNTLHNQYALRAATWAAGIRAWSGSGTQTLEDYAKLIIANRQITQSGTMSELLAQPLLLFNSKDELDKLGLGGNAAGGPGAETSYEQEVKTLDDQVQYFNDLIRQYPGILESDSGQKIIDTRDAMKRRRSVLQGVVDSGLSTRSVRASFGTYAEFAKLSEAMHSQHPDKTRSLLSSGAGRALEVLYPLLHPERNFDTIGLSDRPIDPQVMMRWQELAAMSSPWSTPLDLLRSAAPSMSQGGDLLSSDYEHSKIIEAFKKANEQPEEQLESKGYFSAIWSNLGFGDDATGSDMKKYRTGRKTPPWARSLAVPNLEAAIKKERSARAGESVGRDLISGEQLTKLIENVQRETQVLDLHSVFDKLVNRTHGNTQLQSFGHRIEAMRQQAMDLRKRGQYSAKAGESPAKLAKRLKWLDEEIPELSTNIGSLKGQWEPYGNTLSAMESLFNRPEFKDEWRQAYIESGNVPMAFRDHPSKGKDVPGYALAGLESMPKFDGLDQDMNDLRDLQRRHVEDLAFLNRGHTASQQMAEAQKMIRQRESHIQLEEVDGGVLVPGSNAFVSGFRATRLRRRVANLNRSRDAAANRGMPIVANLRGRTNPSTIGNDNEYWDRVGRYSQPLARDGRQWSDLMDEIHKIKGRLGDETHLTPKTAEDQTRMLELQAQQAKIVQGSEWGSNVYLELYEFNKSIREGNERARQKAESVRKMTEEDLSAYADFMPSFASGTMAQAGSHAVDHNGRIKQDETIARLHRGEIVLNANQSADLLNNGFEQGTLDMIGKKFLAGEKLPSDELMQLVSDQDFFKRLKLQRDLDSIQSRTEANVDEDMTSVAFNKEMRRARRASSSRQMFARANVSNFSPSTSTGSSTTRSSPSRRRRPSSSAPSLNSSHVPAVASPVILSSQDARRQEESQGLQPKNHESSLAEAARLIHQEISGLKSSFDSFATDATQFLKKLGEQNQKHTHTHNHSGEVVLKMDEGTAGLLQQIKALIEQNTNNAGGKPAAGDKITQGDIATTMRPGG